MLGDEICQEWDKCENLVSVKKEWDQLWTTQMHRSIRNKGKRGVRVFGTEEEICVSEEEVVCVMQISRFVALSGTFYRTDHTNRDWRLNWIPSFREDNRAENLGS